ncbi:fatty acid synthase alpha subunit Lsd1 [Coemansia sp. RSA 552]|nr:fatty acid synthase alpha subunit Lsd1 [Coemansia sp. RSA 552]
MARSPFIVLQGGPTTLRIPTPAPVGIAEKLAAEFNRSVEDGSAQPEIVLLARFIGFCAKSSPDVARATFYVFHARYFPSTTIHAAISRLGLSDTDKEAVVHGYLAGYSLAQSHGALAGSAALFATRDKEATVIAAFGGGALNTSGCGAQCIDAIRRALQVYEPVNDKLLVHMSTFLGREAADPRVAHCFSHGFNLLQWVSCPQSTPHSTYLDSAPVALPLLGTLQILRLAALARIGGVPVGQLIRQFAALVGHSHGLAIAAAVSSCADDFSAATERALGTLLLFGCLPQMICPQAPMHPEAVADGLAYEGHPTPMISVDGVPRQVVEDVLKKYNAYIKAKGPGYTVFMSGITTDSSVVVSGNLASLVQVVLNVRKKQAAANEDQSQIPFLERKPRVRVRYLNTMAPFHSVHLQRVVERHLQYACEKGWVFTAESMHVPVRAGWSDDLRREKDPNRALVESIYTRPVDWPQALEVPHATHLVDLSLAADCHTDALRQATCRNIDGRGVLLICPELLAGADAEKTSSPLIRSMADLFAGSRIPSWKTQYGPTPVRAAGRLHVDTSLHRATGMPPVMVGSSTTGNALVVAASQAGYLAELDIGYAQSETELVAIVTQTANMLQTGHGLVLYTAHPWAARPDWLVPQIRRMRQALHLPILGLSINNDAVPASNELSELFTAGLRFLAFRAVTEHQLLDVLAIADAAAPLTIVAQWAGGRGGGRHSFDEFHLPLLDTYHLVRARPNMQLVASSGFGDGEGAALYLSGNWSTMLGRPPMPFDGILLVSRPMAARESPLAIEAKQLIVDAAGLDPMDIPGLFAAENGSGVVSIVGESTRQHFHVIANRAALLCRDLGTWVFSQPADKQAQCIRTHRDQIISRLNNDYMRPWFGMVPGRQPLELEDMTYMDVITRLVGLMYDEDQRRWIDPTYRNFVGKFVERTAMRLSSVGQAFEQPEPPAHYDPILNDIETIRRSFVPTVSQQLLASEDVSFFLSLCRRPCQKAVPFVPRLDENLQSYVMSDAFRQAEDLGVVLGNDPQRVLICQGPVAARYSKRVDQPLRDILDSVYHGIARELQAEDDVPETAYIGPEPSAEAPDCVSISTGPTHRTLHVVSDASESLMSEPLAWAAALAGPHKSWLHALLTAPVIVENKTRHVDNYLARVLRPRLGRSFAVELDERQPTALTVRQGDVRELNLTFHHPSITLHIYHTTQQPISLQFDYHPHTPLAPIHQRPNRDGPIQRFFREAWATDASDGGLEFVTRDMLVSTDKVAQYCCAAGITSDAYPPNTDQATAVPMDYLSVLALPGAFQALTSDHVHQGLLNMMQTAHRIEQLHPLAVGDVVDSAVRIVEISQTRQGKRVDIAAEITRASQLVGRVTSTFVFLETTADCDRLFRHVDEPTLTVTLKSDTDIAVLKSKEWFECVNDSVDLRVGATLAFHLRSEYRLSPDNAFDYLQTTGKVVELGLFYAHTHVANVNYANMDCIGNPVTAFLTQRADKQDRDEPVAFEDGGYVIASRLHTQAPSSAHAYAMATGDHNPHNTNVYVSDMAGLQAPVMQGLWTSTAVRALLEQSVAKGSHERIVKYAVELTGHVLPGDQLETDFVHTGMQRGYMLISGTTRNLRTGELVLASSAVVRQPRTVYVFTGQGSQEQNMGMDLYARSAAAREVADRADKHMRHRFGFSLLEIIRQNPPKYTVYFGGPEGKRIRNNYMMFRRRINNLSDPSQTTFEPLFPAINARSRSYTFRAATGLLNATQFAQPAIMMFDVMAAADMRSRGIFIEDAMFAGHSLGEYGALAAFEMMTLEDIVDITFIRGMTMQSTVERDEDHNSMFAMVAANPSRISRGFTDQCLAFVINDIRAQANGELLEIVNYNVHMFQYVVAGTRAQLALLGAVLDEIHRRELNIQGAAGQAIARQIVSSLRAKGCGTELRRTRATLPIPGIDVPFHSSHLIKGADQFRECINMMIRETSTDCHDYSHRYIPNLTAAPFEVSRQYFQLVWEQTQSPVLAAALDTWPARPTPSELARLARLMVIELLSYQFASPVRWIETQNQLFSRFHVEQVIEIGPSATLCRMADATLMINGLERQCAVKHIFRDEDDLYYTTAMVAAKEAQQVEEVKKDSSSMTIGSEQHEETESLATTAVSRKPAPVEAIDDVPLLAADVIRAVIAQKLKRALDEISVSSSVKDLTGGKSTLQNEILGDLLREFNCNQIPDRPDEISLVELSQSLGLFSGTLGKYTESQLSRLFSTKMPGSFSPSKARAHLAVLGVARKHQQDAVLLCALTTEPPARLASEDNAQAWLTEAVHIYAKLHSIELPDPRGSSSEWSPGTQVTINSAEFEEAQKGQRALVLRQVQAYAEYLGIDLRAGQRKAEAASIESSAQQEELAEINAELGQDFVQGIRGVFSAAKARTLASYWNWAREDLYEWVHSALRKDSMAWTKDEDARLLRLANRADPLLLQLVAGLAGLLKNRPGPAHDLIRRVRQSCDPSVDPVYRELGQPTRPVTAFTGQGRVVCHEEPREATFGEYVTQVSTVPTNPEYQPLIHLRQKGTDHRWTFSSEISDLYYAALTEMSSTGTTFVGTTALVTGCSSGSIAAEVLRGLLSGGAQVVATTSSYKSTALRFYEDLYRKYGARGSELIVVPFNQGSVSDIQQLVSFVYGKLGWNLDYVLPFAAISGEPGADVSRLGARSELALRIMLTNVLRLLGEIKTTKEQRGFTERPTLALLPLSPNHGIFGSDGLYGECKAALETLFNRWQSEHWGSLVSVAGAIIGWTRGTGLMAPNNPIAEGIEKLGARTFSTQEMAFNILGLMHPHIVDLSQDGPVWADLNGGLQRICDVSGAVGQARMAVQLAASKRAAIVSGYGTDIATAVGHNMALLHKDFAIDPLFNHQQHYPELPSYEELTPLHHLQGMANLDKTVVITGYGEIGPYGHAETRWEMEAYGEFSLEGCVELAWVMGLIRHDPSKVGWIDAASGAPVEDKDIKARYEKQILEHTGIRLLETELLQEKQDPAVIPLMRELQIEHNMEPFETTAEEAAGFRLRNGDKVDAWENPDGSWSVRFLKGATLMVPKALRFDRLAGGQLPTGWDPARYGIPADVIDQVDTVTCYALIATMEALVRSGITDPYELYEYFYVAQVGTSLGSGAGGVHSIRDLYRRRLCDQPVQSDILQETFVNTTPAWINMLLLSAAGPIKPPTGGCGTSVLSVDVAADTIRCGKAKVMLAGGFEGFVDQGSYEFAQMGATASSTREMASGRTPAEMSRPCTTTRSGFVEAQGAGTVVLMSAQAALEYGAPIYAILAHSSTATDRQAHSLPAPGGGIMTSASEVPSAVPSPLLDISYRRRQLRRAIVDADQWAATELARATCDADEMPEETREAFLTAHRQMIARKRKARRDDALDTWGTGFWMNDPGISPLRGSLAAWGLTADDIGLASFHGTGTYANDKNESDVLNAQLKHMGRTPGNAVPAVCQKWLTGHPKGPAAAWMLNGALQSMRTGVVPGNRNADSIDPALQLEYIMYPSRSIQTSGIKAGLLKSFGFGQVGAEILVVHPDYLAATLTREQLAEYSTKLGRRRAQSYRYWQNTFNGNHPFIQVKDAPPFTPEQEQKVYLDPLARAAFDKERQQYHF